MQTNSKPQTSACKVYQFPPRPRANRVAQPDPLASEAPGALSLALQHARAAENPPKPLRSVVVTLRVRCAPRARRRPALRLASARTGALLLAGYALMIVLLGWTTRIMVPVLP